jgi:PleD family two-component response regulator
MSERDTRRRTRRRLIGHLEGLWRAAERRRIPVSMLFLQSEVDRYTFAV